jgi:cyclophilin family peptidyl-prolyl cis-trans isomerase
MRMTSHIQLACWTTAMVFVTACSGRHGQSPSLPPRDAEKDAVQLTSDFKPLSPRYQSTDVVVIKTSLGEMAFELYGKQAPKTVANFLEYIDDDFYSGKTFHRVINGFMIQGGGFDESLSRADTRSPISLEIIPGLKHTEGVISMARQPSDIHSATSQFFVCTSDAPQLNGTYAAFGKLISGEETLRAISKTATHTVETDYGKMDDVPITPVVIEAINHTPN